MRDILFRGKRIDNGKWTYGGYCASKATRDPYVTDGLIFRLIDPVTVGQYTGLTDKNGKKIFEGDICRCYTIDTNEERLFTVGIGECTDCVGESVFCAVWSEWCGQKVELVIDDVEIFNIVEVIGNIHDNPELLEGTT